jgi:hypothetical protein
MTGRVACWIRRLLPAAADGRRPSRGARPRPFTLMVTRSGAPPALWPGVTPAGSPPCAGSFKRFLIVVAAIVGVVGAVRIGPVPASNGGGAADGWTRPAPALTSPLVRGPLSRSPADRTRGQGRRSHRGRYHTDRHLGDAAQYTSRCPGALSALAATAGPQSHSDHDTVIRPGSHSWPFAHRSG